MQDITIIGAGNGGFAAAADLTLRGFRVTLFEHPDFSENLSDISRTGCIGLSTLPTTGLAGGFARPAFITTDIKAALLRAEVILVVVPAFAHIACARKLSSYLRPGQIVVLMPGGFCGAILFRKTIEQAGGERDIIIAETATLPYACRKLDSASVWIRGLKASFEMAAYPAQDTQKAWAAMKVFFPAARPVQNVLETSLNNLNPFIHPPIVLLNVGSTERGNRVLFYHEGVTPGVQNLIEEIDNERMALGNAFSLALEPIHRVILSHYSHQGARGDTFRETVMSNPVYSWSEMPSCINSRYLTEDIPMNLMPICELAQQAKISCRVMESVITMTEAVLGKNLRKEARTLSEVGIAGRTKEDIQRLL